ncbi:SRPBCC family protein [Halarcobacter sp.]|uniref:SRPBCC family protein n=1 Tax=Halarcobacter sp. TaxID=2321133 RepID=UPI002AA7CD5F|nr:SRPBCC family protein [Halarcobacter sp.]
MKRFEKSIILNCTLQEVFDFHLDVNNLKRITPPDMKVILLNEVIKVEQGTVLKIKSIKNFIPTYWEVEIKKIDSPNLLVDYAIKSPFKYWEHSHIFTKRGNQVELKDVVIYKLPFGKLGKLFDFFIKKELNNMFEFRHQITKKILSSKKLD